MNSLEELNGYVSNTGIVFEDDRDTIISFFGTLADHNFGIVEDVAFDIPDTFNGSFTTRAVDETAGITITFDFSNAVNPEVLWPAAVRNIQYRSNPDQTQGNPDLLPWSGNPKIFFAEQIQLNRDFLYVLNTVQITFIDQESDFDFTISASYPDPANPANTVTHTQTYNVTVVSTSPELQNETLLRNYTRGAPNDIFATSPISIVDVAENQVYRLVLESTAGNLLSIPNTVDTTGWDVQPIFNYPYQSQLSLYGTKEEINAIIPQVLYHGIASNALTDSITYELRNIYVAPSDYITASGSFNLTGVNRTTDESFEGIFIDQLVDLTSERLMYSVADFFVVGGGGGGGINLTNQITQQTYYGKGAGAGGGVKVSGVDLYNLNTTYGTDLLGVTIGSGGLYDRNYNPSNPVTDSTNGGNSLIAGGGGGGTLVTAYGGGKGGRGPNPTATAGVGGCGGASYGGTTVGYIKPGIVYQSSQIWSNAGGADTGGGLGSNGSGLTTNISGTQTTYGAGGLAGDNLSTSPTHIGSGGRGGNMVAITNSPDPYQRIQATDGEPGTVIIVIRKPS